MTEVLYFKYPPLDFDLYVVVVFLRSTQAAYLRVSIPVWKYCSEKQVMSMHEHEVICAPKIVKFLKTKKRYVLQSVFGDGFCP